MKLYSAKVGITALMIFCLHGALLAQKHAATADFKSKLWYGMGVGIGFSGFNGASQFGFGLAPMVGYKIFGPISAGPRVSLFYSSFKLPNYRALNTVDIEAGAFVRGRVFRGAFLQGEVSNSWLQEPYIDNGSLTAYKYSRFNQYLGLGYNFGGGGSWSSELGAYYNFGLANDLQSSQSPWEYRFNLTYNFW